MVQYRAMICKQTALAMLVILLGSAVLASDGITAQDIDPADAPQHPLPPPAPPSSVADGSQQGHNDYAWTDVDDARREYTPPFAFPGAEGFGVDTPGGRGGAIIRVDTLQDSLSIDSAACLDEDAGSPCPLRTAVSPQVVNALVASGDCPDSLHCARIVVFEVGGTITLAASTLNLYNPFLTIAGQTAPPPGINLVGGYLQIRTHDVVIQHTAVRPGSCMEEPLPYCQVDEDCPTGNHVCIRNRCRLQCTDSQFCADNGYGAFNRSDASYCAEYGSLKICTCREADGIRFREPLDAYYVQYPCLEDYELAGAYCLPKDRGSTAEPNCQCGDICNHLDHASGCPCDPIDDMCCNTASTVAATYGCDFDSDCQPLAAELCASLGPLCSVGCVSGYCTPLPLPDPEQETYNIVLDHVSASWANDEVIGMQNAGVHDITVSNSIIALGENFGNPKVSVPHGMGLLVGPGMKRVAIIGNLFAHNRGRNPDLEEDASSVVANNLVYNPAFDAISHPGGRRMGPALVSIWPHLMVTGHDTYLAPLTDSSGLVIGTEHRIDQYGFDYLSIHEVVTTVDGIPAMMPLIHSWPGAPSESQLWVGYRTNPLDSLYSEWGSGFSPAYANTAKLQDNDCPGGDPDFIRHRSGGPYLIHFPLDGTVHPPAEVSPLTTFANCDEMLQSIVANAGARPRDRDPVDSDVVASFLNRTGQHPDETICTDSQSGLLCQAIRCDSAQGCTVLWSWTMPAEAARGILPPPLNPADCPGFVPGDPSTYPDPLAVEDLLLPCNLEEIDAQGYTRLDWWLYALSLGLKGTVDPSLRCPRSNWVHLPLVIRDLSN